MKGWFTRLMPTRKRIYLDTAATTPVRPEVLRAMTPYFSLDFANPGALYREGVTAARALSQARTMVARALSVRGEEITFTSGGTEANNLAILGSVYAELESGTAPTDIHVISTELEHSSILAPLKLLAEKGVAVSYIPVDESGIIKLDELKKILRPETFLISVHLVNNEIGVIQPIRDIARLLSAHYGTVRRPLLHTDASQAPLYLDPSPERLGVDMLTLDAQKMYGPKGVGALFHRHHIPLLPILYGGGQERGLRSGTEPIPLVVGMAYALSYATNERAFVVERAQKLRDRFFSELKRRLPEAEVNGSLKERIANNVNISIPGVDTEFLVIHLDREGISVSTKSTCLTDEPGSYTVLALGKGEVYANSTLRITLGIHTTWGELNRTLKVLVEVVKKLKKLDRS